MNLEAGGIFDVDAAKRSKKADAAQKSDVAEKLLRRAMIEHTTKTPSTLTLVTSGRAFGK
jgi:hypothetical protein